MKLKSPSMCVSRLCGLTSCLAEPCLCTFVRELYSVQQSHNTIVKTDQLLVLVAMAVCTLL